MFSFNVNAPVFIPKVGLPIFNDGQLSAVRILDCDEYFTEFLQEFNPKDVADEDLWVLSVHTPERSNSIVASTP